MLSLIITPIVHWLFILMQIRFFLFILLFFISSLASAKTLSVDVSDNLPRHIQKNIIAYLGTLPETNLEREVFVFTAKRKALNALNALGYYRASVTSLVNKSKEDDTWALSITVVLNQPTLISNLQVTITGEANNDTAFSEFVRKIPIVKGDVLHHGIYEKVKEDLASLALERGYFEGKFTQSSIAIHKDLKTADIIISFESGPRYQFGDINFNYLEINEDVLKSLSSFKKGDFYQQSLLQNLQNELDETQYFSHVIVRPDTDNALDTLLPIDVSLQKAKQHQLDFGLGYSTDTEENFSFGWKTPLVNRYGHRQEMKLSYSRINPTGYFTYSIPLTHPNDDLLQFKALLEEDEFADLTSTFYSFQIGRVYFDDDLLRQPYLKYLTEEWDNDGTSENASYFIPGFTWSDKSWKGSILDPREGFRQYYNLEGSYEKIYSETTFLRFNARWKYVSLLAPKHRIVTRAEIGYILVKSDVEAELSPSLRFYAGGDQSIRGFSYQSIGPTTTLTQEDNAGEEIVTGGTNMIVASMEYQYYFSNEWRGALFTDGGSVNNTDKLEFVYSIGTGIHYISPIGPIRFALGYPISEDNPSWHLHFSIGADL
jgi:translocation and assembly module TamA